MKEIRVPEVKAIVSVDGERMNFISLKICQRMSEHHDFELAIDYKSFDEKFFDAPEKKLTLVNKKVVIDLQNGDDISRAYVFSGLITSVRMLAQGAHGAILLTGKSPTVSLERGVICQTYSNTNLYTIINEITEGAMHLSVINNADWNSDIAFAIQFKESDWDFLRRTLHQYNVQYHYNGLDLIVGSYPEYPVVNLTYDMEISSLEVCSRLLPNDGTNYFYRREDHSTIRQDSPREIDGANYYLQEVSKQADYLTMERKSNAPIDAYVPDMDSLIGQMNRKKVATGAEMMYIRGEAKCVDVLIGRLINIKFPKSLGGTEIGTYRVYEVVHQIDQNGRYVANFEAVPANLAYLPTPEVRIPVINQLQAEVWRNSDPAKIGRIQVKFPFDERVCDYWMPTMSIHAGGNGWGAGPPSRGFAFTPEPSDSVVVSFFDNNLNDPYVQGSVFHGSNAQDIGGASDNAIKTITTRSGISITFNDNQRSLNIEDPSGNKWSMDGDGNIRVVAPNLINITSEQLRIEVLKDFQLIVGNKWITDVMGATYFSTPYLKQIIKGFLDIYSDKALLYSNDTLSLESNEISAIGSNKIFVHSDKETTVNSKGVVYLHGQQKTSFTNHALAATSSQKSGLCDGTIEFRLLKGDAYTENFGFDWLRIDDNEDPGDEKPYKELLKQSYNPDENQPYFEGDKAYEELENKYKHITTYGAPTYYVPYLTIYPSNVEVKGIEKPPKKIELRLKKLIKTKMEKIEIHYAKEFFKLNGESSGIYQMKDIAQNSEKEDCSDKFELECVKEFGNPQFIDVFGYRDPKEGEESEKLLIGQLQVCPNATEYRKTQRVVLIPLKFKMNANDKSPRKAEVKSFDIERLTKIFYQFMIYADIIERGLEDLQKLDQFKPDGRDSFISLGTIDKEKEIKVKEDGKIVKKNIGLFLKDYYVKKYEEFKDDILVFFSPLDTYETSLHTNYANQYLKN